MTRALYQLNETYAALNTRIGGTAITIADARAREGKSVTVKFLMNEDSSLQTSFVIDDSALTVS